MRITQLSMLFVSLTLFGLSGCTTATKKVAIFEPFLPNQIANFTEERKASVIINFNDDKKKRVPTKITSIAKTTYQTSSKKADGSIDLTYKVLSSESISKDGKEIDELPPAMVFTQSKNGKLSAKHISKEQASGFEAANSLAEKFNFPKSLVVGKTYQLNITDKMANSVFSHVTKDPELVYETSGWVRINKADKNFAWGEMLMDFVASKDNEDDTVKITGKQNSQFKYNRMTHWQDQSTDKIHFDYISEHFRMISNVHSESTLDK